MPCRLIPAALHRALLPLAHRARGWWWRMVKPKLAGCSIIATDLDGRVLLVRHSYGSRGWSLPGGGIKRGEEPASAAIRELREETGCIAQAPVLVAVLEETLSGAPHEAHIYSAMVDEAPRPDRREILEARFFPVSLLPEPLSDLTRQRLAVWTAGSKQR